MTREEASRLIELLFQSWYPALVRYAARLSGSREVAEDAAQEGFLALYRECRKGSAIVNPRGYTLLAVRNQIATQFRKKRLRGEVGLSVEALDSFPDLQVSSSQELEESEDINRFLSVLTPREAEVVLLRLQGLKYREIATELKLNCSSVNTLLARAMRKLHQSTGAQSETEQGRNLHLDPHVPETLQ
jgi:RNA polymerase sigma factor (sigma-70 family)